MNCPKCGQQLGPENTTGLCAFCSPIEGPRVLNTLDDDLDREFWERAFFAALTGCLASTKDGDGCGVAHAAHVADQALYAWRERWQPCSAT
jgi:hypothetical protein